MNDLGARAHVSRCNFTRQYGTWGSHSAAAAAIDQQISGSLTDARFTLFMGCIGGLAIYYRGWSGDAATFTECAFLGCGPVIAHDSEVTGQDVLERCFFSNTTLRSSTFLEWP